MIYHYKDYTIDLAKITRLYPAVLINAGGESALVSLEWAASKIDKISLEYYVLVCDFDQVGEAIANRIELKFETKEELFDVMNEIAHILERK